MTRRQRVAAGRIGLALAVVMLLSGCPGVHTEPVKGVQRRGQQEGPLPGIPEEEKFVEQNVQPPPYPEDSKLIEFYLRGLTTNKFYIDGSSLRVDKDKVVRFVLVIRTPEDVRNVSFAGLRCSTREWKNYAFAREDHSWNKDESAEWKRIQDINFNNYQRTLYEDYFCIGSVLSAQPQGDAKKLVSILKNPPTPDPRVPRKE